MGEYFPSATEPANQSLLETLAEASVEQLPTTQYPAQTPVEWATAGLQEWFELFGGKGTINGGPEE